MRILFDDFETYVAPDDATTKDKSILNTGVWLAQSRSEDEKVIHQSYSIDDYMMWVLETPNVNHVFHNLAGFDSKFIFTWLLDNGFHHYRPDRIADLPGKHTISMRQLWKDNQKADYFEGDKRCFTIFLDGEPITTFYDSLPLMNASLRSIGESLDLPHVGKGGETPLVVWGERLEDTPHRDADGRIIHGTRWTWDEAQEYMNGDTLTLCAGAKVFDLAACLENGILTQAKLAWETLYARLETVNPRTGALVSNRHHLRQDGRLDLMRQPEWLPAHAGYPLSGRKKKRGFEFTYRKTVKMFSQRRIPTPDWAKTFDQYSSTMNAVNGVCKAAYKGGFCWVNPQYQNQEINEPGMVLDITSMYPHIYMTCPLVRELKPGGLHRLPGEERVMGHEQLEELTRSECIIRFTRLTARCRDDWPPILKPRTDAVQTARIISETDNSKSVNEVYERNIDWSMTLTSEDVAYLLEAYDIHHAEVSMVIEFERSSELESMFREHGTYWIGVKEKADGYERQYAKIMVNACYGKLGQYTREYSVYDYFEAEEKNELLGGKAVGGRVNAEVAAAALITARGRRFLGEAIHRIGIESFYYCDTDSLHIKGVWTPEQLAERGIEVHETRLGAFKIEAVFDAARYIQPKTYGELIRVWDKKQQRFTGEQSWHTTAAGLTRQVPREQFERGMKIVDYRTTDVRGGCVILPVEMEIAGARGHTASRAWHGEDELRAEMATAQ